MQIDWWTLALQTINLLVLVWLLGRFLFRPIARIVEERQAKVDQALDDARSMREEAEASKREADDRIAQVLAERDSKLEEAGEEAARQKARLVDDARHEADKMLDEAREEIDRMRAAETAENAKRASELAVDIASRLLERISDEVRISGFLKGLESAISALPAEVRNEIGKNGEPVGLRVAPALSEEENREVRKSITDGLGREVEIAVTVDPDLIAGIEIDTPHAIVRNSLRADLDRITSELVRDGGSDG